jgi:hypothetical protein
MNLQFSEDELMVLDKALQQMPYYLAAPIIESINRQINAQRNQEKKND